MTTRTRRCTEAVIVGRTRKATQFLTSCVAERLATTYKVRTIQQL